LGGQTDKLNEKRDDKRSAAFNPQVTTPRRGFTDVGLHTGGHARDTSWPEERKREREKERKYAGISLASY
jgi:hypothetical protein